MRSIQPHAELLSCVARFKPGFFVSPLWAVAAGFVKSLHKSVGPPGTPALAANRIADILLHIVRIRKQT